MTNDNREQEIVFDILTETHGLDHAEALNLVRSSDSFPVPEGQCYHEVAKDLLAGDRWETFDTDELALVSV